MERSFYRSLDREFQVFGIKGKWVQIFLICAGVSLLVGFIAGTATSSGIGIAVFLLLAALSFLGCIVLQNRVPSRRVDKVKISGRMHLLVVRRESLGRILSEDPLFNEYKKLLSDKKKIDD